MDYKFKYSAGLPGYGINGKDGSIGLTGFSIYLTDLSGTTDQDSINTVLSSNKSLMLPNDSSVLGWPTRLYQNGDVFIDIDSGIYVVKNLDSVDPNKFEDSGIVFKANDFLPYITNTDLGGSYTGNYKRYANARQSIGDQKLIDSVFGDVKNYYTMPSTTIYGIQPQNFPQISHSSLSPDEGTYNPYILFNNNASADDAVALVRNGATGLWRLGNMGDSGARSTNLSLDFDKLYKNTGSIRYEILSKYDIDASILFATDLNNSSSAALGIQDAGGGSVIVNWSNPIMFNRTDVSINTNVIVFPINMRNVSIFSYESSTGSLIGDDNKKYDITTVKNVTTSGSVTISNLDESVEYAAYLEYSLNGWIRRTRIARFGYDFKYINVLNKSELLNISANGEYITLNVAANTDWNVTNVTGSWLTASKTTPGDVNSTIDVHAVFHSDSDVDHAVERYGTIELTSIGATPVIKRYLYVSQEKSYRDQNNGLDATPWILMTRGTHIVDNGRWTMKIRRVGQLCVVQGTFDHDASAPTIGEVIARVPFDSLKNPLNGKYYFNSTVIYFTGSIHTPTSTNDRTFEGKVIVGYPTLSLMPSLELSINGIIGDNAGMQCAINFSFLVES